MKEPLGLCQKTSHAACCLSVGYWSYSKPLGRSQDLGDFGCNTKNEGSLEFKHRALASALWGLNPLPTTH